MNRAHRCLLLALIAFSTCCCATRAEPEGLDNEALGKLKLGLKASELIALIGAPDSKGEDAEWAAIGEWVQEWRFESQGLRLNLASAQKGGAKTVFSITATPPCKLVTKRGIHLGSSIADVAKAYADVQDKEQSEPGQTFVAGSIYGGVIFSFSAGKVSEIFIGAAAE